MRVISAPDLLVNEYFKYNGIIFPAIKVFLAGGITDCDKWQDKVINYIEDKHKDDTNGLILVNPRRKNFPIHDPNASSEQISWEYNQLEKCDIFSMYFCSGSSDQPICMYELGRNICRIQERFSNQDYKNRIIVSVQDGYKRAKDVEVQTFLTKVPMTFHIGKLTPEDHAEFIYQAYKRLYPNPNL